jgi:hypothetical protein
MGTDQPLHSLDCHEATRILCVPQLMIDTILTTCLPTAFPMDVMFPAYSSDLATLQGK